MRRGNLADAVIPTSVSSAHNGGVDFMKRLMFCMSLGVFGCAALPAMAATPCATLSRFSLPGHAIKITQARDLPAAPLPSAPNASPGPRANVPAHCHVEGVIDERIGRNG